MVGELRPDIFKLSGVFAPPIINRFLIRREAVADVMNWTRRSIAIQSSSLMSGKRRFTHSASEFTLAVIITAQLDGIWM